MSTPHVLIIGGGLAGLSAGAYARASGFRTTIVEHNIALGGVCTAWHRGQYVVDGCIHWLTGGPFTRIYEELGILPAVGTHVLDPFTTYRDETYKAEVPIVRDLDELRRGLERIAPEDADELRRLVEGARRVVELDPGVDKPKELWTMRDGLASLWNMRSEIPIVMHFRKTLRDYTEENLKNPRIRRLLRYIAPADGPALFLLMVLGYLERGYLTRPVGGTERFRDELIRTYERLGGESLLHATVDEVLVKDGRAVGVRLDSGAFRDADVVISTSSAPETIQRLLGGRFGAAELDERLSRWKLFDPIVLASFGVEAPLSDVPSTLLIDHIAPLEVGGKQSDYLYLRVFNDDPAFAPPGHSVVQAMLPTTYEYWAKQGSRYGAAKDDIAERVLARLAAHIPGLAGRVRMTDIATPLTYWSMSRSWRGAFEGWMPNADSFLGHVKKTLPGLTGFYMAGQWVEPGGGVPVALMSGRQVAQLVCNDLGRTFVERPGEHTREAVRSLRQHETAEGLGPSPSPR